MGTLVVEASNNNHGKNSRYNGSNSIHHVAPAED